MRHITAKSLAFVLYTLQQSGASKQIITSPKVWHRRPLASLGSAIAFSKAEHSFFIFEFDEIACLRFDNSEEYTLRYWANEHVALDLVQEVFSLKVG